MYRIRLNFTVLFVFVMMSSITHIMWEGIFCLITLYLSGISCQYPVLSPVPVAYVIVDNDLNLTCTYPGKEHIYRYRLLKYVDGVFAAIAALDDKCDLLAVPEDFNYYCFNTTQYTWTKKRVGIADHGTIWKCGLRLNTSSTYFESNQTEIQVIVPITTVTLNSPSVNTVNVIENITTVEFVCETTAGRPQATITWYMEPPTGNAEEITTGTTTETRSDANNLIIVTGRLRFSSTRLLQGWMIYCSASNVLNDIKTSIQTPTLNVLYAPVAEPLSSENILQFSSLSKLCQITFGNPTLTTYRWTRSKGGLTQTTATLTLNNVTRSDADTYTCRAQNTMSPTTGVSETGTDENSFTLAVLYKASITTFREINHLETTNVTVNESDSVRLQCLVESYPGSTIQIRKDAEEKVTKLNTNQVEYSVAQVTCSEAELYTCIGFNKHNADERPNQSVQLYVLCSPRQYGTVEANITRAENDTATLSVTVLAYPEPSSYVWDKWSGRAWTDLTFSSGILISSKGLQSNLTIVDIAQSDYGQYRVTVTNAVGVFQQLFNILPYDIADPMHQGSLSGAVIGGIAGGLVVLVLVALVVILNRKYQLTCEFKRRAADNPGTTTSRKDRSNTEQLTDVFDPVSQNTDNISDPSPQYTSLTGRDLSADAYDTVQSIDIELKEQSSSKTYENLQI